jgi:hypothetical protein
MRVRVRVRVRVSLPALCVVRVPGGCVVRVRVSLRGSEGERVSG